MKSISKICIILDGDKYYKRFKAVHGIKFKIIFSVKEGLTVTESLYCRPETNTTL